MLSSSTISRLGCFAVLLLSLDLAPVAAAKPEPAYPEVSYGPNPNQVMDVYLPKTAGKAAVPVLIWYGTIWKPGRNAADLNRFLSQGIAVIAAGTRTMTEAHQAGEKEPASYVMNDACRAVQFVLLNALEWGIQPDRIAVGGGSQGSLPALYAGHMLAGEGGPFGAAVGRSSPRGGTR